MSVRHSLCRLLLPAVLAVGVTTAPTVWADIPPFPRPQPDPPQPPLPPDPYPIPDDDDGVSRSAVIAAAAASVGVTLLGVWVIRRQLRRTTPHTSAVTT